MEKRRVLESWKEISDYLSRSIKTCQRWEVELGLPIHRIDGTPSARVFAYADELDGWMAEKLNSAEAKARESAFIRHKKKKWVFITTGVITIFAVAAFLIWRFFFQQPVSFPVVDLPGAAFLPFENVTGDEILEAWRTALPQLFTIDLLQSKTLGVEYPPPYRILKKLKLLEAQRFSVEDLKTIGKNIVSLHIATGSLIRSGKEIIVNLFLHDSKTGELIYSYRTICQGEKCLFSAVDELTKKLKLALNIPPRLISHDIDEDIGKITTDSPEALKLYCQGNRLAWEGKFDEAIPLFKKATEIDPEFSEAFYQLYQANRYLYDCCEYPGAKDDAIRYGKKAFELSDRLNVWTRGFLIEDYYLRFQKNFAMAIAEWKKLLAIMDKDPIAMLQLAQIYSNLEEYDKVIALLKKERLKEYQDPRNILVLADSYARTREYGKAETILDDYLSKKSSAGWRLLYLREVFALNQNKFDEALAFNERLKSQFPKSANFIRFGKGPIFVTQDDFVNAENEFQRFIEQGSKSEKFDGYCNLAGLSLTQGKLEEAKKQAGLAIESANRLYDWASKKRAHFLMACLHRLSGNLPEALKEIEQACPCYKEDDSYFNPEAKTKVAFVQDDIYCLKYFHLRALLSLEMGRIEEFEKQLAEIKQLIEQTQYSKLMRAYYHLLGHKELRENNFDRAIDYFWKALNLLPASPYGHNADLIPPPYGHGADIDSAQYYYSLAEAYYQAGRCWSTLDLYKRVASYWDQRVCSGDIYAKSFYRMAKIYDQCRRPSSVTEKQLRTDKAMAIENYRKFLSLWKDADPIFGADVEDARKRLAALEAE
jgi:tetratricopeptide (TPR) repeat protein